MAIEDSITYVREWLDQQVNSESPKDLDTLDHIHKVLMMVAAAPTIAAGDRYHYALGQLAKAREFLLQGRAAAAMDAIHRAMDGIIEE